METRKGNDTGKKRKRILVQDTKTEEGLPVRVMVPEGIDPSEGIPVSMPLDEIYGDLPSEFRERLYNELWARGLVSPSDYLKPGADQKFKSAIMAIIRVDWRLIVQKAQECTND